VSYRRKEQIGPHTLYLGDCLEVMESLSGVDFIFTDPPYGHKNNDGDLIANREKALGKPLSAAKSEPRPIENDSAEDAARVVSGLFSNAPMMLPPGGVMCCCCCGGGGPDPQFARWALEIDRHLDFKQMVVWDKGPMGMGWHYRRSYEVVLVASKPGAAVRWYDETGCIENIIRPGYRGIKKIIPSKSEHPTPKPNQLGSHFIRLHTSSGDCVLDPFMGGGSTGVAAVKMGRSFIGVEIDEKWFDYSCKRIEEAMRQPDLFVEEVKAKDEQIDLLVAGR
jgi:site-specific DNA-methyltransferase (adenine-specific)